MGTMSAQQVTGSIGLVVAAAVAVMGLAGALTEHRSVEAAGQQPEVVDGAPLAPPTLITVLPTARDLADAEAVHLHDVVAGDTLSGIAQANGTTVDALAELNGLDTAAPLQVGQVLQVPAPPAQNR